MPNLHLSAKNRIIPDDITALKQVISVLSFFGLFVPNVEIWLAGVIFLNALAIALSPPTAPAQPVAPVVPAYCGFP